MTLGEDLAVTARTPLQLNTAAALWMASAGNAALWLALWRLSVLQGLGGVLFGLALLCMTAAALVALMSVASWPLLQKTALISLLLATAAGAHFMLAYGTVIDPTMMVNVLQTDRREATDLLTNLRFVAVVGVLGLLPAWLVWRTPLAHASWPRQTVNNMICLVAGIAAVIGLGVAAYQPLSVTMRNHRQLRYLINPLNSLYGLAFAAWHPVRAAGAPLHPLGTDATLAAGTTSPPLLLLVVGETARSGNFSLNGYPRNTTPELAAQSVISWRNAWSCGTNTAASVPCMFSHLGREGFDHSDVRYENLLDVLQHAGLAVLWLDNQAGCKGVCSRVAFASASTDSDPAYCRADGECRDEILLKGLGARIAALPAPRRARGVVVVMHQMGSHGPAYHKRSPAAFKRFLPECTTSSLQQCTREEVVNAYDNTIAYTDHVLAQTVAWLRHQSAYASAMVYVSDHGESLGENNLYLHGLPYAFAPEVQKRVPWITWLSPAFIRARGADLACMAARRDTAVSHDNYFHSVLGLLGVRTAAYRSALDAYAGCVKPAAGPVTPAATP